MDKKCLLVIDDSPTYRAMLRLLFQNEYTILEAADGREGCIRAKEAHPDIILCDVVMPLDDGYVCCHWLKTYSQTNCIPIIMLTSKNEMEDIITGLKLGIDDYIVKPCDPLVLKMKVGNLVKNRELLKAHYAQPRAATMTAAEHFGTHAVRLIEKYMSEPEFGVQQLADLLFVSPTSLYRKIKDLYQISPQVLIRKIRLKKAADLLKTRTLSVIEVAELIGYNDVSSFRKHFTEYFGKTPLAYGKE